MSKPTSIEYICWRQSGEHPDSMEASEVLTKESELFCVAGFLVRENNTYLEISSTQDVHTQGAEDVVKIVKKNVVTRERLNHV